ncbi:hypothetical protein MFRU_016g00730 [Monilinia fructicola]|nr:hypothetical protein MFRU_016g00730 [Monilinia fructicola]
MATKGVWQNITALFSGLTIGNDVQNYPSQPPTLPTPPTFELFSQLPVELRIKIWKYSLPGPRLLRMVGYFGSERVLSSALSHPYHLLHVSREAREVALTRYCVLREPSIVPLYINSKLDLLCFLGFDDYQKFFKDRINQIYEDGPVIDKLVVFAISETKELNVQERIEDIVTTSFSATFVYPDLKSVIFVLERLQDEVKTREINERLKEKSSNSKTLDLQLTFTTMEDLVMEYNVETDSQLGG